MLKIPSAKGKMTMCFFRMLRIVQIHPRDIVINGLFPFLISLPNTEYSIPAVITYSQRNQPNIIHDGYTYCRHMKNNQPLWICNHNRCSASIQTQWINGQLMMRVKNQKHICLWSNEAYRWLNAFHSVKREDSSK